MQAGALRRKDADQNEYAQPKEKNGVLRTSARSRVISGNLEEEAAQREGWRPTGGEGG